jgi:hypothetical protein
MVYFETPIKQSGHILEVLGMENVGIFYIQKVIRNI